MKTTSRLGGRKAHTAKGRRVRYETSTRVLEVWGVVRMVRTLLHAGIGATSARAWSRATRAADGSVPPVRATGSPFPYGSVTAPRSAPVTSRAYLASTPVV